MRIDAACPVSPSASASAMAAGRDAARPRRLMRCTVDTRTKSAALRPPRAAAAPLVGSTWLEPVT